MQLYYMNRDGHSFVHSTIALVCAAMAYKLILVLMGIGIALFWWQGLKDNMGNLMPLYFLGLALNSVLVLSLLLLLAFGAKIEKIILVPERFLIKIHLLKDSPKRKEKLHEMVLQYADTVVFLRTHVQVILHILAVTFVQRCAVFGLTYFVYRGMGLSGTGGSLHNGGYAAPAGLPGGNGAGVCRYIRCCFHRRDTDHIHVCNKRHQLLPAADYQCECGRVLFSEEEKRNCTNLTAASVRLELRTMPI